MFLLPILECFCRSGKIWILAKHVAPGPFVLFLIMKRFFEFKERKDPFGRNPSLPHPSLPYPSQARYSLLFTSIV